LSTMEELRNTQQQLLMKEKMAALGDLVAGIAHEINNPIGTVTSSTDVTGRCLQKIEIVLEQSSTIEQLRSNPQLPKAIKIIKDNIRVTLTAGHRIATIVKSLKNFAGLDEATYRVVDIHDGLDSTLTLLESEFRGRIEIEKQYGELPKVGCYPSQLNQVFMNLLKNAVQAIENKGVVRIQTRRQDGRVEIKISDSGRGIPAEKLSRIFDFGFSSGSERVKMGSGLVTAFNIIQKHDGEILANSEPGKGSTFTVLLPVR
ncbi:MAG: ATP-binding protein, partial [Calditrichaeota bacterium]|nr:ATP-binding protein [Calditrichota bacterium]